MRGFYSSLLQRNAQLKSLYGGGSMSTLVMMDEDNLATVSQSADEADRQSSGTYTLEDFDGPFFSNKTRARMALLVEKGIAITDEVRCCSSPVIYIKKLRSNFTVCKFLTRSVIRLASHDPPSIFDPGCSQPCTSTSSLVSPMATSCSCLNCWRQDNRRRSTPRSPSHELGLEPRDKNRFHRLCTRRLSERSRVAYASSWPR